MAMLISALGLVAGLCCLIGAGYWFRASKMPLLTKSDWSGNPELNYLSREADLLVQLSEASRLNAIAARWTGVGAITGAAAAFLAGPF